MSESRRWTFEFDTAFSEEAGIWNMFLPSACCHLAIYGEGRVGGQIDFMINPKP